MQFYGYCAQNANGETTCIGKLFTIILTAGKRMERSSVSIENWISWIIKQEVYLPEFVVYSQSVKLVSMIFEYRDIEAYKKINECKWQLLVDTGGHLWAVHVHAANEVDGHTPLAALGDIM